MSELRRRLIVRSKALNEEKLREIERRLARAEREITTALEVGFDYVVVNDVLEEAVERLVEIIRAERLRPWRMENALEKAAERSPELEAELAEMERWMIQDGGSGH